LWFLEPVKLKIKLFKRRIKGKKWEEILPEEDLVVWKEILMGCVDLLEIKIPRFFLPSYSVSRSKIRLVCLADSAEFAGGTAVYSGKSC